MPEIQPRQLVSRMQERKSIVRSENVCVTALRSHIEARAILFSFSIIRRNIISQDIVDDECAPCVRAVKFNIP